jgi:hypothetical protein
VSNELEREPSWRQAIRNASSERTTSRLLDDLIVREAERDETRKAADQDFQRKMAALAREQDERTRLAAQARAYMEADRIRRELATLDAIDSIRTLAEAAAAASAEREQRAEDREHRMLTMTNTLVKVTWALLGLGLVTVLVTIVSVLVSAT